MRLPAVNRIRPGKRSLLNSRPLPLGSLEPTEFTEVDFSFYFRLRGPEVKNNRPPGKNHADILSDL
jgi:hypothetical protein